MQDNYDKTEPKRSTQLSVPKVELRDPEGGYINPGLDDEDTDSKHEDSEDSSSTAPETSSQNEESKDHQSVSFDPDKSEVKILVPEVEGHPKLSRLSGNNEGTEKLNEVDASIDKYIPDQDDKKPQELYSCYSKIRYKWNNLPKVQRRATKLFFTAVIFLCVTVIGFLLHSKSEKLGRVMSRNKIRLCDSKNCIIAAADILDSLDESVSPCDDFYHFACGGWQHKHPNPPTIGKWDRFSQIRDQTYFKVKELLEKNPVKEESRAFFNARKMFKACMNQSQWEFVGVNPLLELINEEFGGFPMIKEGWTEDSFDWLKTLAQMRKKFGILSIVSAIIGQDDKNSTKKAFYISQGLLLLNPLMLSNNDSYVMKREKYWMRKVVRIFSEALDKSRIGFSESQINEPRPVVPEDNHWAEEENSGQLTNFFDKYQGSLSLADDQILLFDGHASNTRLSINNNLEVVGDIANLQKTKWSIKEGLQMFAESKDASGYSSRQKKVSPVSKATVEEDIKNIWNFLVEMAKIMENPFDQSEEQQYNPMTVRELMDITPTNQINWLQYLQIIFEDTQTEVEEDFRVVVAQPNFFRKLPKLIQKTPKRVLANVLLYLFVVQMGNEVTPNLRTFATNSVNENSEYIGRDSPRPWFDCVEKVAFYMDYVVTYLFLNEDYASFKEDASAVEEVLTLFNYELKRTFQKSSWMDASTQAAAVAKVSAMQYLVGFPESKLQNSTIEAIYAHFPEMSSTDHFANMVFVTQYYSDTTLSDYSHPPSPRDQWLMNQLDTNAIYSFQKNSIQIPSGILQPPFYRRDAILPLIYGSIGAIAGHEMIHGFDTSGKTRDWQGNLNSWWSNASLKKYNRISKCYESQYNELPLNDVIKDRYGKVLKVNGEQTKCENIADNEGLRLSWRVYKRAKMNNEYLLKGLEKYSSDQLFFISAAQMWCTNFDTDDLVNSLKFQVHTPAPYRVNGFIRNNQEFPQVFNCPQTSDMTSNYYCALWG